MKLIFANEVTPELKIKLFSEEIRDEISKSMQSLEVGDYITAETLDNQIVLVSLRENGKWYVDFRPYLDKVEGYSSLSFTKKAIIANILEVATRVVDNGRGFTLNHLFQVAGQDADIARQCFEAYESVLSF